jgi:hypothetical protein
MAKVWNIAEEADQLKARFEAWGGKQAEFARIHNVPGGASMLSQHIHGRRPMNLEAATAYAHGFNVPLQDISPRLAVMVEAAASDQAPGSRNEISLIDNPDYPAVRRVSFKLSAGVTGHMTEYEEDSDLPPIVFRREWYALHGYQPDKLLAAKVSGASMEPTLFDGDLVVVNTDAVTPKDGKAFAVNYEGVLSIKRLVRDGGEWWIRSDNPDKIRHPDKRTHEGVSLIGQIVYRQSERI